MKVIFLVIGIGIGISMAIYLNEELLNIPGIIGDLNQVSTERTTINYFNKDLIWNKTKPRYININICLDRLISVSISLDVYNKMIGTSNYT